MVKKCSIKDMEQFSNAHKRLGDRADWELRNMKKALTTLGGFFNNEEDNQRLEDVNTVLRLRKKCKR